MKIIVLILEFTFLTELTNKRPTLISSWDYLLQVTICKKWPERFCYVTYHHKNKLCSKTEDLIIFILFLATLSNPIKDPEEEAIFDPNFQPTLNKPPKKSGDVSMHLADFAIFSVSKIPMIYLKICLHTTLNFLIYFNFFPLCSLLKYLIFSWCLLSICHVPYNDF